MPLLLTHSGMRAVLPRAPMPIINAFVERQDVLVKAGILNTRPRFAFAIANVEHECGGFTIPNLTENINYSAQRMAEVWPGRFGRPVEVGAAKVRAKYGTAPGWQKKAFDDIYGNRMGNRPGTSDGSRFIGRGGPQVTGRDGYEAVGKRCGIDFVNNPEWMGLPEYQPAILAAFVSWKGLNKFADTGNFIGGVKVWNGGTNGLADRKSMLSGNDPFITRMQFVDSAASAIQDLPGETPSIVPAVGAAAFPQDGIVFANGLNVRSGAGTKFSILRSLQKGASVTISDAVMNGNDRWLSIAPGQWVSARFVELKQKV